MFTSTIKTWGSLAIEENLKIPKFQQLVNGILHQIDTGNLKPGDRLPSINETSSEYFLSRDTVEKAYGVLYKNGHLTTVFRKGFFVAPQKGVVKVIFLAGCLDNQTQKIYYSMSQVLGKKADIDIHFHDFSLDKFSDKIQKSLGEYHYYVVLPQNFEDNEDYKKILKKIPNEKLILLNNCRCGSDWGSSSVNFGCASEYINVFNQNISKFKKYKTINLVLSDRDFISADWMSAFANFCKVAKVEYQFLDGFEGEKINKNQAYLVFEDCDLIEILKQTKAKSYEIGNEIGVVSFREDSTKELLGGGISTIVFCSQEIGNNIAEIIKKQEKKSVQIPLEFISRASF
jgi:DNA-binding transcriptional regulator YhcF (GntR family)